MSKGITVFKLFIWGGISSDKRSEKIYGEMRADTVKRDFQPYIRRYTSPNEKFKYGYPHSTAPLQSRLKLKGCKLHIAAHHPTKSDVINDVKLFPTVFRRIYCRKFLTLSN